MLKDWLVRRRDNPYPSRDEKKQLAIGSGLTYIQICNWFANWRRKLKNAGREPAKRTWGTLIKNYNTSANGNVEQFSISSNDSIWGDETAAGTAVGTTETGNHLATTATAVMQPPNESSHQQLYHPDYRPTTSHDANMLTRMHCDAANDVDVDAGGQWSASTDYYNCYAAQPQPTEPAMVMTEQGTGASGYFYRYFDLGDVPQQQQATVQEQCFQVIMGLQYNIIQ